MNQNQKFQLERETVNHHWVLRLRMGMKTICADKRLKRLIAIYILVSLIIMAVRPWLFIWNDDDIFSVMQRTGIGQLFPIVSIGGLFLIVTFLGTPIGWKSIQNDLQRVGLVNHAGEVPILIKRYRDYDHSHVTVLEFESCGIPKSEWEDKQEKIETALNVYVAKIREGYKKKRILLYTVPYGCELLNDLKWQEHYLCGEDFELILGESYLGKVKINLAQIPHILLGGSTGSGKSVLLKLLLMQCLRKGATVCIADFKGGVDFPDVWHRKCRMIFDREDLLDFLSGLVDELERRKETFRVAGCSNIGQFNGRCLTMYERITFACDEVAELLDKNGLGKDEKELVSKIENKLSVIARQGRAFGIHLILATQRPDATILTGQIRNNINCRVCGRADSVLSQIILDSSDASDKIPKDAQGRFLMHDGTIFQGYLFDEKSL